MSKQLVAVSLLCLLALPAIAKDTILNPPLADVIALGEKEGKLDGSVKFFLKGQKTPSIAKKMDEDVSNQKTNGLGKSDEFSCQWAALSALINFQNSAKQRGANAVVDITSYYKKNETKSASSYECHVGTFVTGTALKGRYAKI